MSTLSEIIGVEQSVLEKIQLEPHFRCDPNQSENVQFLSPLVLLEDNKLKQGGYKDWGAKKVLGRVTKDILEPNGEALFQVPEVVYMHMGYGKKSENKKGKMALTEEEAKVWKSFLSMSRFARTGNANEESTSTQEESSLPQEESSSTQEQSSSRPASGQGKFTSREEGTGTPMEINYSSRQEQSSARPASSQEKFASSEGGTGNPMEIDLPTPEDTQALDLEHSPKGTDSLVFPNKSGLEIPLKGRYVLLFSILLIFFDKKKKKKQEEEEEDSDNEEKKIGANKISDFLLFWILPYLLNFNHCKVREIIQHHRVNVRDGEFNKFVEKSTLDIIKESFASCEVSPELKQIIQDKYKDYYGMEQLKFKYKLLKTNDDSPLILVPKQYIVRQMPATIDDIGRNWRAVGNVTLLDEFMDKFIKNKEIQEDFLYSLRDLRKRQGINYSILLPDEITFNELIGKLEEQSAEFFSKPEVLEKGGRNLIFPRIGLLTNTEKHFTVGISYFQGGCICIALIQLTPGRNPVHDPTGSFPGT